MNTLQHPDLFSRITTASERLDETARQAARAELRRLLMEAITTPIPTDEQEETENDG